MAREAFLVLLEAILPGFSLDQQQQEDSAAAGDGDFMEKWQVGIRGAWMLVSWSVSPPQVPRLWLEGGVVPPEISS